MPRPDRRRRTWLRLEPALARRRERHAATAAQEQRRRDVGALRRPDAPEHVHRGRARDAAVEHDQVGRLVVERGQIGRRDGPRQQPGAQQQRLQVPG
jgi:hypothetical protein